MAIAPLHDRAVALLQRMLGSEATFRPGQFEAIEALKEKRQRVLVVQRTGWGKSVVYFLTTKLLREDGSGPTLLISPLLSLMRDQIRMAKRIGIHACTIHSANRAEWNQVEADLGANRCDVLLISPERLNNEHFLTGVLPKIAGRIGLFVVDEAHCISDWGHDFRPDYRRIARILKHLPRTVPVLATTATANNRVVADIQQQLGENLLVLRGPLARSSLRLQSLRLADQAERLAWLAENVPKFKGSGIIYCMTVADTKRVADWLQSRGITAKAYHSALAESLDREALEDELRNNQVKALVATVALGMGFDKPDLSFVIHYQSPGSVVAYYQQVGRAGRAIVKAYGILLSGHEDSDIQNWFIDTAIPPPELMTQILDALKRSEGLTFHELLAEVNVRPSTAERALKLLEIDGAVGQTREQKTIRWFRTPNPWQPDLERIVQITEQRRQELKQMQLYLDHPGCSMEFLAKALDDPAAAPCRVCAACQKKGFTTKIAPALIQQALQFLRRAALPILPRKLWPTGLSPGEKSSIPKESLNLEGRALSSYGDAGWGRLVRDGKYRHGHYGDDLVEAAASLIGNVWKPQPAPQWVTAIPSLRHPQLVAEFARRLAQRLKLPFRPVLACHHLGRNRRRWRTAPCRCGTFVTQCASKARSQLVPSCW